MEEQFAEITVTRFDISRQDTEFPGLFHFSFPLSRPAPDLWQQIAAQDLGQGGKRGNICIGRLAWAYADHIIVRCTPQEAQGIKDALNNTVLPSITKFYRSEAAARRARQTAKDAEQARLVAEAEAAVRNQR